MTQTRTDDASRAKKPLIVVTGASGGVGQAVIKRLKGNYRIVGIDRKKTRGADAYYETDLTESASVELAFDKLRREFGDKIAAVIHLAAYFDFTGKKSPAYDKVNIEGSRNLMRALREFEVERLIYSGTMLVHRPGEPGERIDESTPLEPKWIYPESKAETEELIRKDRGDIPVTLLRIAGLYDDESATPTLAHQIARIYERSAKSHLYSGDLRAGQAFIHSDDLVDAFERVVERRRDLPEDHALLVGESEGVGYRRLQDRIAELIHDEDRWPTLRVPKILAKPAAWLEEKSEPIVPDDFDRGEKPFIRAFMIDLSSDHYALNTAKARKLLGWTPQRNIYDELPALIDSLKRDPAAWYKKNDVTAPRWIEEAAKRDVNAETLRKRALRRNREERRRFLWAPFLNIFAGSWLLTAPTFLNYEEAGLAISTVISGAVVIALAALTLHRSFSLLRYPIAAIAVWLMFAPLVFETSSAAAYAHDSIVGALIFGFALLTRPTPGVTRIALEEGPDIPPGWEYNPSAWLQRMPVIVLAVLGLHISRYLVAYQLGHIDAVWDPFFAGAPDDPRNGTEEIITSEVSRAWPVPDAGLGVMVYTLEILIGLMGSARRWRTMPWAVFLFALLIVPLGVVSITFIIIQPIVIGTWCALCLIAAAAMVVQIPYALDEFVASFDFLRRKRKAGAPVLRIFFTGDTDEGDARESADEFNRPFREIARDFFFGASWQWNLLAAAAVGVWLMFTRLTLGAQGAMADADHLIGSLVIVIAVIAMAETARPLRLLNIAFGVALFITPFGFGAGPVHTIASIAAGAALIAFSLPRGKLRYRYGGLSKYLR